MKRVCIAVLVMMACEAHAAPQEAKKGVEPSTAARAREPEARGPRSESTGSTPVPKDTALPSAGQLRLLERFVASDVLTLAPEQATARFAGEIELKRERESIDGFVLAGGGAAERLELEYSPDGKGKFYVGVASLLFYVASTQVPQLQTALVEQLTKKLGKPKKQTASGKSVEWKLSRRVELVVLEYASRRPNPDERVVELRIAEPGGP